MPTWALGSRFGIRLDQYAGPWISLGVHLHIWPFSEAHIDLHIGWWLLTIGRHYGEYDRGHTSRLVRRLKRLYWPSNTWGK